MARYVSSASVLKPLHGPLEPIRFYNRDDPYYEFTNFYPSAVTIDGKAWPSTEHYFQAQKFVGTPYVEKIRQFPTAREAFQLSRTPQVSRWCRQDWQTVKDDIMLKALRCKFRGNAELRKKLLGTGNRRLIEHTQNDSYWGDGGDGSGKNQLGKLLEKVRSELQCATSPDADFRGLTLGNKRAPPAQQPLPSVVAARDSRIYSEKSAFKNHQPLSTVPSTDSSVSSLPKDFKADSSSSRGMAGSSGIRSAESHFLQRHISGHRAPVPSGVSSGHHAPVPSGYHAPVSSGYHAPVSSGYHAPVSSGVSSGYHAPVPSGVSSGYHAPVPSGVSSGYHAPVPSGVSSGYHAPVPSGVSSGYHAPVSSGVSSGYHAPVSSGHHAPVPSGVSPGHHAPVPSGVSSGHHAPVSSGVSSGHHAPVPSGHHAPVPSGVSSGYHAPVPSGVSSGHHAALSSGVSSGQHTTHKMSSSKLGHVRNYSSSTVEPKTGRSVSSGSCIGQDNKKTPNVSRSTSKYAPHCSATQVLPKGPSHSSKATLSSGTAKKISPQSPSSKNTSHGALGPKRVTGVNDNCTPSACKAPPSNHPHKAKAPPSNHPHKAKAPSATSNGIRNLKPHPPDRPSLSSHSRPASSVRRANDSSVAYNILTGR